MAKARTKGGKFASKGSAGAPAALAQPKLRKLVIFTISDADGLQKPTDFESDLEGDELEAFKLIQIRSYAGEVGVDPDNVKII